MARILYADDNADLRRHLERIAPRLGHEAVVVDDAARAWELLDKGEKFDLIISDFDMPEMNGGAFLRKVKGDPRTAQTPFALISGHDDQEFVETITEMGARFFSKAKLSFYDMIPELLRS